MIFLTVNELVEIHSKLISATGGNTDIRDISLLESAVYSCLQTTQGKECYPTILEKATRLAFGICQNHPFIDGNKRVAEVALLTTLKLNKIHISYTQDEITQTFLTLANGKLDYANLLSWIESKIVK